MAARTVVFVAPNMMYGGAERQLFLLASGFEPRRTRPVVLTLNDKGPLYEALGREGVETIFLDAQGLLPFGRFLALVNLLKKEKADVVLTRGFNATVLGRLAGWFAGVPVIVAEHATGRQVGRGWWHDAIDRALVPLTAAYVAVAHAQLPYLTREKGLPADRIYVIHNGIVPTRERGTRERAREALGFAPGDFVVGIVAVLRPEKDHVTFLAAARKLFDREPRARFAIIGDGVERLHVERMVADLGLEGVVRILGARSDVPLLLAGLDIFTLCSYTVETFPMSALEAMDAGIPIVATAVGGVPEMVEDGVNGLLVPPRNAEALAGAWERLVEAPALCEAMGEAGRRRVLEEFSASTMVARHDELFDRLLDSQVRRRRQ